MSPTSGYLEMDSEIETFYDGLAGAYHLLFADWRASVERQGAVLDQLIRDALGPGPKRVLDCSCGIGTQAIGLARRGHSVTATDLSAPAVRRAEVEAERLGVEIDFRVCDMRELPRCVDGEFDAIVSCDNSLPHLLSVEELDAAIGSIYSCLLAGGVFIASTRDYDAILLERPTGTPVGLSTIDGTLALEVSGGHAKRVECSPRSRRVQGESLDHAGGNRLLSALDCGQQTIIATARRRLALRMLGRANIGESV